MSLQVATKKSKVDYFEYTENRDKKAKMQEVAWAAEFDRVLEWAQVNQPHLNHSSIFVKADVVDEILNQREKAKEAEQKKKIEKRIEAQSILLKTEDPEDEHMESEQDSGTR